MKSTRFITFLLLAGVLFFGLGVSTVRVAGQFEEGAVLLKLKYASFDPLASEPAMPENLHLDAYPQGAQGAYIVQFNGPIQDSWKEQIAALGGKVMDYLPDYAFLVWMDGETRANVATLENVRWVGIYQPAYKLSPEIGQARSLYQVFLFPGTDTKALEARLGELKTPTLSISGEQFLLMLPEGNIEAVAAWPETLWVEPFMIEELHNDVGGSTIMNTGPAWAAGLTGSGMTVTVADTGIDSGADSATAGDMHADFDNRMAQISSWPTISDGCGNCCWPAGANDGARDLSSGHGTHVLGSVGGNGAASSGQFKGPAYQAALTFQAVEQYVNFTTSCELSGYSDGYYLLGIPSDLNTLFQQAYNWGSRVHSNSWGSNVSGEYRSTSQDVDEFIWAHPDMVILYSAGNAGTDDNNDGYVDDDSIGAPGTAKNAITSGASESERASGGLSTYTYATLWPFDFGANPTGSDTTSDTRQELAAFSSRGPTNDGRLKPDIVAPGTNIVSARSGFISGNGWGAYSNTKYMYMGGTSMSNPLIAGAATLVREYYIEKRAHSNLSAALVKATMINSAVGINGYGNTAQEAGRPIPNNHEGWGMVNVGAATSGQRNFQDGVTVTTGATRSYTYQINSAATPFKVTLVWSDYPGSLPAGGLVNNLNLRVTAPNGTIYLGNRFSNGWSITGGSADTINNVESVYIQSPATGAWKVEVIGANVPHGPQPFAFVATGSFQQSTPPTVYKIYQPMQRKKYGAPPPPTGPTPGFWRSPNQAFEFYVTSSRTQVDNFAIYVTVTGCGNYKITHTVPVNITNSQFSSSGAFYFNGTFDSQSAAHGIAGLSNFNIAGCGQVNGGPWNWTASWINSNPPPALSAGVEMLDRLFTENWLEAFK